MGKEKNFESNGLFYEICQATNLYLPLRVSPIEINSHKFCFVPYVFLEISGHFLDPKMTPKLVKSAKFSNFSRFNAIVVNVSTDVVH